MSIEEIKQIGLYSGGVLLLLMTIIQIAPIKINPWSWIGRCIGRAINAEVLEKVDTISKAVNSNKEDDEQNWAELHRTHILRFGDEIRLGIAHSEEHFNQVLDDIHKYIDYCKCHPCYLNDKADATIALIKQTYATCLKEDKFL